MGIQVLAGVAAIAIGLILLAAGGAGHHLIRVSIREGSVLGQAWLVVLVMGFLLIAIDAYLTILYR